MRTKSAGQRAHTHFLSQVSAGANVDIDSRRALTCPVNANVYVTVTESGRRRTSSQEFQNQKAFNVQHAPPHQLGHFPILPSDAVGLRFVLPSVPCKLPCPSFCVISIGASVPFMQPYYWQPTREVKGHQALFFRRVPEGDRYRI